MSGQKYRVKCALCGWRGVRTDKIECECYDDYARYCRPGSPGPGCPRGIVWPCPKCGPVPTGTVGPNGGTFRNNSSVYIPVTWSKTNPKKRAADRTAAASGGAS